MQLNTAESGRHRGEVSEKSHRCFTARKRIFLVVPEEEQGGRLSGGGGTSQHGPPVLRCGLSAWGEVGRITALLFLAL